MASAPSLVGPPGTCKIVHRQIRTKLSQDLYKSKLFLLIKLEYYLEICNSHAPYSTDHQLIYKTYMYIGKDQSSFSLVDVLIKHLMCLGIWKVLLKLTGADYTCLSENGDNGMRSYQATPSFKYQ